MADEAITIRVTYQEGWALVLYLAANGDRTWSINAFDESLDSRLNGPRSPGGAGLNQKVR